MSDLYVLDTDCFTLFQHGHKEVVAHAAAAVRLAVTIVTVDESLTGWYSRVRQSTTSEQLATAYRGLHKAVDALRRMEVLMELARAWQASPRFQKGKIPKPASDLRITARY